MIKRPLAQQQKVYKRPKLRQRPDQNKDQKTNETNKTNKTNETDETNAENDALQVYYELLNANHWRPLHSDIEKDVRRSNCENSLRIPYNDTKVIVRMPAEDCSNALEEFQESNPMDIIERNVLLWNASTY